MFHCYLKMIYIFFFFFNDVEFDTESVSLLSNCPWISFFNEVPTLLNLAYDMYEWYLPYFILH